MGKMKEIFITKGEQNDLLDADYQYEQWLEKQKLENQIKEEMETKVKNKNTENGNIK